jgi:hypothetical protein
MTDNVIDLSSRRRMPGPDRSDQEPQHMATIEIFDNSRVRVWVSNEVSTSEQWNWLFAHVARASHELIEVEMADKPTSPRTG